MTQNDPPPTLFTRLRRIFFITLFFISGLWFVCCFALYFLQEKMLFVQQPNHPEWSRDIEQKYPQSHIQLPSQGVSLEGWLVLEEAATTKPLLLYFSGNAENSVGFVFNKVHLPGISLATFNYRGYGQSQGNPTEAHMFADALTIYDFLTQQKKIPPQNIVVMGRSMGSGVATYLASQRDVRKVILVSPYDSITNVASRRFPLFPVRSLIRHPFASHKRAPKLNIPLLCFLGERDRVIPPSHTRNLVRLWKGKVTLKTDPSANHNNMEQIPGYWKTIRHFTNRTSTAPTSAPSTPTSP